MKRVHATLENAFKTKSIRLLIVAWISEQRGGFVYIEFQDQQLTHGYVVVQWCSFSSFHRDGVTERYNTWRET